MNRVLFWLISFVSGILFGIGMVVSGMAEPTKVIGFLDIVGEWDPSLMFVMGGALLVFMPAYFVVIKPKSQPLAADSFSLSINTHIDRRLVSGATLFGLGWGIAGICPGPVVSSLSVGNIDVVLFFVSMMMGLGSTHFFLLKRDK